MAQSIREILDVLRNEAPLLNAEIHQAAEVLRRVENELEECKAGIFAYAFIDKRIDREEDGAVEVEAYLTYGRINGRFQIYVMETLRSCDENGEFSIPQGMRRTPWGSCPRHIKTASFEKLPALLDEIVRNVRELREEIKSTRLAFEADGLIGLSEVQIDSTSETDKPLPTGIGTPRKGHFSNQTPDGAGLPTGLGNVRSRVTQRKVGNPANPTETRN